jgi:hypothetical protein
METSWQDSGNITPFKPLLHKGFRNPYSIYITNIT